jgi:hypothetical protein
MNKIEACVGDLVTIAKSVASQDLSQAKRRLELLFADAGTGGSFGIVQKARDQLAQALNQSHGPNEKRFLSELIAWLDREHLT